MKKEKNTPERKEKAKLLKETRVKNVETKPKEKIQEMASKKIEEVNEVSPKTKIKIKVSDLASEQIATQPPVNKAFLEKNIQEREESPEEPVRKGPGRPKGSTNRSEETSAQTKVEKAEIEKKKRRTNGYQLMDMFVFTNAQMFGQEFHYMPSVLDPQDKKVVLFDEKTVMREGMADFCEYYQWDTIPMWATIPITLANYYGRRLQIPSVQIKAKSLFERIKGWGDELAKKRQAKQIADLEKMKLAAKSEKPTISPV